MPFITPNNVPFTHITSRIWVNRNQTTAVLNMTAK